MYTYFTMSEQYTFMLNLMANLITNHTTTKPIYNEPQKDKIKSSRDDLNYLIETMFLVTFAEMIPIICVFGGIILCVYTLYFIFINMCKLSITQ